MSRKSSIWANIALRRKKGRKWTSVSKLSEMWLYKEVGRQRMDCCSPQITPVIRVTTGIESWKSVWQKLGWVSISPWFCKSSLSISALKWWNKKKDGREDDKMCVCVGAACLSAWLCLEMNLLKDFPAIFLKTQDSGSLSLQSCSWGNRAAPGLQKHHQPFRVGAMTQAPPAIW